MPNRKKHLLKIGWAFLIGSVVLVMLSFFQKILAGFNPFTLKGYLVAVLFGGISGAILGTYLVKVIELNAKLKQRVDKSILMTAMDGFWLVNTEGRLLEVNESYCRMSGYGREELLGLGVADLESKETAKDTAAHIHNVITQGWDRFESKHRGKDGRVFDVEVSVQFVDVKGGQFVVFLRNITERKRVEEKLNRSRVLLHNSIEGMLDAYALHEAIFDENGEMVDYRFLEFNPAAQKISNIRRDQIVGKTALELYPHIVESGLMDRYARVMATGVPDYIEDFYYEGDSLDKAFEINCFRIDEKYLVCIFRDITDRKQAEEALRAANASLTLALKASSIGPWDWDLRTDQVYFSAEWKRQIGYDEAEIDDRYEEWESRLHPEDRDRVVTKVKEYLGGQIPEYDVEFRLRHKDGSYRWISTQGDVLRDENGVSERMLGCHVDITERKRMEEELAKASKLESVGILAGGIAHDFNNILMSIVGNISLAKLQLDDKEKALKRLVLAEKASQRAQDLTQQLLTFSKGGTPVRKMTSVAGIVKDSADLSLRGSNVRCEISIPDDLWPAEVDEGQINQIINNLVLNAQQAMPEGGVIEIQAENIPVGQEHEPILKDEPYVKISINDNGIGISKQHIDTIFDPFFTTKEKGHGLGLAVSFSIIRKHDGHITVESELEAGSTFNVYLPAFPEIVVTGERPTAAIIKGRGRILLMDDEAGVRETAKAMIELLGYEAAFARDGSEAIAMYKKAKESGMSFDIVIMDLTIPGGMGGQEAVKKLLEIDPEAKVIVSSGYSTDPVMSDYRQHGFTGVISKPYSVEKLGGILHTTLAKLTD